MFSIGRNIILSVFVVLCSTTSIVLGFKPATSPTKGTTTTDARLIGTRLGMSTVIDAPTKEDIFKDLRRRTGGGRREGNDDSGGDNYDGLLGDAEENKEEALRKQGPLEWLEDNILEERNMKDPFHILLLDLTFEKPKITVPYVASNLEYVLAMPPDDAKEHSQLCYDNGMTCVGVWPREECLRLGRELQLRDIVCRIVPYAKGGDRAWQANTADVDNVSYSLE